MEQGNLLLYQASWSLAELPSCRGGGGEEEEGEEEKEGRGELVALTSVSVWLPRGRHLQVGPQ